MFCSNCGNQLPGEALFCNRCGMRMLSTSSNAPSGEHGASSFPEPTIAAPMSQTPPGITQLAQPLISTAIQPPALSPTQRWLVRIFKPELAKNALFGSIMGSLIAFLPGILISLLVLSVAHTITPASIHPVNVTNGEEGVDTTVGIVPMDSVLRDATQLFLVMHGVGEHLHYTANTNVNNTFNYDYSSPLNGLLVIPALLLILGGYLAASTDLLDRPRSSLLRGMAIALPYTCLLLIVLPSVNGSLSPGLLAGGNSTLTLNMDVLSLIVFGLLWAAIFGLLGASLKLAHGQWRRYTRHHLHITPYAQLIGPVVGSLVATGFGLALSFLLLCSIIVYTQISVPLLQNNLCLPGIWQYLTLWGVTQGPLHAINLFFFSLGAPVTIHTASQGSSCFYNALPQVLTIRGGLPLPPWFYLVLLIPAFSLFLGGRTSAALARARDIGSGAVSGAAIALPFTMLMMLLTSLSSITQMLTLGSTGLGSTSATTTYSAGVGAFDVLLWSLLFSAVLGVLGGLYQTSTMSTLVSRFLVRLASSLKVMVKPLYLLSGRSYGQTGPKPATSARSLFYGAFLCALLLLFFSLLAGGSLITFNQTFSVDANQHIRDICSLLLVALPGLFLVAACFSALCNDPGKAAEHPESLSHTNLHSNR